MRILHVNKFLYRRGGAESYMLDVADLQRDAGHEVAFFGMDHPLNPPLEYAAHFPSYVEFDPPPTTRRAQLALAGRMLWSTSAARGMAAVVDDFRPDVVHLHNIYHQLSPSVLRPLQVRAVASVMTLHDYKLACPTYQFLDKGEICEACLGGHFTQAVRRRCEGGSLAASTMAATELALHTRLGAYRPLGLLICPSRFIESKMRAAGVLPERLRHIPHFAWPRPPAGPPTGGVLFAGRLAPEKGVDVLVEAVGRIDGARLDIAGDGPQRARLEQLAAAVAPDRVTFHGLLARDEVDALLGAATVVVLPARWYENQPMAVLEALSAGVPVVASDLGGASELIEPGVDGELVAHSDPAALAEALGPILADPSAARAMGARGRDKVAAEFAPARHLDRLDAAYTEAGRRRRAPS